MAGEIKRYAYGEEPDEIWLELLRYYLRDGKHRKRVDAAMAGNVFYDNTRAARASGRNRIQSYTGLRLR